MDVKKITLLSEYQANGTEDMSLCGFFVVDVKSLILLPEIITTTTAAATTTAALKIILIY